MLDFSKLLKKMVKYLAICLPFLLIVSALLISFYNVPLWLNILINVLLGIILCFIFELISVKIQKEKAKKEMSSPKKKDPFAD